MVSAAALALTRWAARLLAASFLLADLSPPAESGPGLFASLANELWDAAVCAARAPLWLSILLLVLSFAMLRGALWSVIGERLAGGLRTGTVAMRRDLVALRPDIYRIWRSPDFRPYRRRLVREAFSVAVLAGLSGAASVALAAWILSATDSSSSLLAWVLDRGWHSRDQLGGGQARGGPVPPPSAEADAAHSGGGRGPIRRVRKPVSG